MTIRQPTADPMRWWRLAVMDPSTPRHDSDPQPGLYAHRYVTGGPLVPVEIRMVQELDPDTGELAADERLEADELGKPLNPATVWTHLRPITRSTFDALVERHRSDPRMAATHVPYDLSETPIRPMKGTHYA